MSSKIMPRSPELSQIERLDLLKEATDTWRKNETLSKTHDQLLKKPSKKADLIPSFISMIAFRECHKNARESISEALNQWSLPKSSKKETQMDHIVHMRDLINDTIKEQREPLKIVAIQQIKKGQWVDHLQKIPSTLLIHGIIPFLQLPVKNLLALNVFDHMGAEAFQKAYLDSYVGPKSRAHARWYALTMELPFKDHEGENQEDKTWVIRVLVSKMLAELVRDSGSSNECLRPCLFSLCDEDTVRLFNVLKKPLKEPTSVDIYRDRRKIFKELYSTKIIYHRAWFKLYGCASDVSSKQLSKKDEEYLNKIIYPTIQLFKEIQKMKTELAFKSNLITSSLSLRDESPTIAKLSGKRIIQKFLVPYLYRREFASLKHVSRGFHYTFSNDPRHVIPKSHHYTPFADFFKKYEKMVFVEGTEIAYSAEFRKIFHALPFEVQEAYEAALNKIIPSQATRMIKKEIHTEKQRLHLKQAYQLIEGNLLKVLADKFNAGTNLQDIYNNEYRLLSQNIQDRIQKFAYCFVNRTIPLITYKDGSLVTPPFQTDPNWAKSYALACSLLEKGKFKFFSSSFHSQLQFLSYSLNRPGFWGSVNYDRAIQVCNKYIKDPKGKEFFEKTITATKTLKGSYDGNDFSLLIMSLKNFDE